MLTVVKKEIPAEWFRRILGLALHDSGHDSGRWDWSWQLLRLGYLGASESDLLLSQTLRSLQRQQIPQPIPASRLYPSDHVYLDHRDLAIARRTGHRYGTFVVSRLILPFHLHIVLVVLTTSHVGRWLRLLPVLSPIPRHKRRTESSVVIGAASASI
jgi:hypothetical protein